MWLVNAALRRPYSVVVAVLLVVLLGLVSYMRTPTDILPNLKVPVVVVFASYRGMPAPDMEQSVTAVLERALTKCDYLEHIESHSLLGIGIIHVFFRPQVDPDVASSQVIALVNGEMQNLPPGMLPPTILKYDASAIPVGNLVVSSNSRDDRELLDIADHQLRDQMAGIPGLSAAPVFGGVFRQVQIYVHPRTLQALKLSPVDVARIVNAQSQVIPTGEMRIGTQDYYVSSNSMVADPDDFKKIPLWAEGRKVVYLGDVADIKDDARWRTNTVTVDGRRAVYMPLLRQAGASAVHVVDSVQAFLPKLHDRGIIPEDVRVDVAFDQSQYVRDAIGNLRLEALGGAVLASLVVLLFLGSIRCTWVVALSIPLSILAALGGLYFTGNTLNIMTLGGLALVLGRVVDDSIVDVENTVRHLAMGKTPLQAARDSAQEIAVPVLMATITTVVVFLPLIFITGVGKYLFTPLAVSAAMAMGASYVVSRTVSPLYNSRFLRPPQERERFPWLIFGVALAVAVVGLAAGYLLPLVQDLLPRQMLFQGRILRGLSLLAGVAGVIGALLVALGPVIALLFWLAPRFDHVYEKFAALYERCLRGALRWRWGVVAVVAGLLLPAALAMSHVGQELFPEVDASEFTIHLRATGGPRVEETERKVREIENIVREIVPAEDLKMVLTNIGLSSRWSAIYTSNNGPHAAFLRVQLRSGFDGRKTPTVAYVDRLRQRLRDTPGLDTDTYFYETGGMIRHILNSGAVAPIEVQVYGESQQGRRAVSRRLHRILTEEEPYRHKIKDTYMPQGMDLPQLRVDVDRTKAQLLGYTQTDVIRNVITALMSSSQISPNLWIDPRNGNPYLIGVQYAPDQVADLRSLEDIPISSDRAGRSNPAGVRLLRDVAQVERTQGPVEVFHHSVQRVDQLFISVAGNDLAAVAADVEEQARQLELPKDARVEVRGEVQSMRQSFQEMAFTLCLAVVIVYLVMAAQFASWLDPLIMIVAAPLGLIGVAFILWATHTSLNIQSCMGVLMMLGISVSNSVLLVEFANRQRAAGLDTLAAIVTAARVRLRPILMTTLATIAGLLPMALHLHPGDEMNLPLARAVIGGLAGSTLLTLFVVPILYVFLTPRGAARPGPAAEAAAAPVA
jgi:multidrug efflux pump subunit AcrB